MVRVGGAHLFVVLSSMLGLCQGETGVVSDEQLLVQLTGPSPCDIAADAGRDKLERIHGKIACMKEKLEKLKKEEGEMVERRGPQSTNDIEKIMTANENRTIFCSVPVVEPKGGSYCHAVAMTPLEHEMYGVIGLAGDKDNAFNVDKETETMLLDVLTHKLNAMVHQQPWLCWPNPLVRGSRMMKQGAPKERKTQYLLSSDNLNLGYKDNTECREYCRARERITGQQCNAVTTWYNRPAGDSGERGWSETNCAGCGGIWTHPGRESKGRVHHCLANGLQVEEFANLPCCQYSSAYLSLPTDLGDRNEMARLIKRAGVCTKVPKNALD